MNKEWVLTQEDFDSLLAWLHDDREQAARKYEAIRRRLIEIFHTRGCGEAEDLADETINRVTSKVREVGGRYEGDPALYFYAVAKNVFLEYTRRKPLPTARADANPPAGRAYEIADDGEREYECLEKCLGQLTPRNRELVVRYYQENGRGKIDNRKELASRMGLAINALRIRAHRIRSSLQQCVRQCLEQGAS